MSKIKDAIQTVAQEKLAGVFNEKAAKQMAAAIADAAEHPVLEAIVEQLSTKKKPKRTTPSAAEKKKAAEKRKAAEKKAKEKEAAAQAEKDTADAEGTPPAEPAPEPQAATGANGGGDVHSLI